MYTCNKALALALRPLAATKAAQTAMIATMLGANRVLRIFRDPSPTAKHPALTGTEVLNVTMTGALSFNAGAIVGFGSTVQTNINIPVDLAVGKSILRIEGNGNFCQGTVGLDDTTDFTLTANMMAGFGIAFDGGASLSAYNFAASGIGPAAPEKTRGMAHVLKYYDWTDPQSPALKWTNYLTARQENWSYQHAGMAQSNGDAAIYQTPTDSVYGNFLFGATLVLSAASNTEVGNVPLQQVTIAMAYSGSWQGFPLSNAFSRALHILSPPAFKIVLEDMDGNVLHVFEMHDGAAINDPTLRSGNMGQGGRDVNHPLQPKTNVMQQLVWQNTYPRRSDISTTMYSSIRNYRPTMSKGQSSMISVEPLITGGYGGSSANGLADFWYARQWPEKYVGLTITDPNLDTFANSSGSSAQYNGWIEGWGYEPGAYGTHNWYTSPGGPRGDRCPQSSILTLYLDDPTGVRPQESAPYRDMINAFGLNYFNHSNHFTPSPSTLKLPATNAEMLSDVWAADGTYYGSYGRNKMILFNGDQRDGERNSNYDMDGNMHTNGWARDPLHDYASRGMISIHFNSPLHGICNKFDFFTSMMLHQFPFGGARSSYMTRVMAWQWLHIATAWQNASTHPLGITQKEVEDFFAAILEAIYNSVTKPVFVDNEVSGYATILRNFGINAPPEDTYFRDGGGRLGFYIGHVLVMMKQSGLWSKMRQRNAICSATLLNLVRNLDTFCFGNLVDAKGQGGVYFSMGNTSDLSTLKSDWAAWYAAGQVPDGNGNNMGTGDFIFGTYYNDQGGYVNRAYNPNPDVSWNQFEQYARMRPLYFPEIAHPKMAAAITELDNYEAIVAARVAAAPDAASKRLQDYQYRYPGVAPFNGPLPGTLGPA